MKTCKHCGKTFETKAHNALYCPDCRKVVKKERRKKSETVSTLYEKTAKSMKDVLESQENPCKKEKHEDSESDLIKMAEQNVLNRVREAQDWIKIMRILRYAGGSFFSNYGYDPGREAWDKGVQMAENALFSQLCMYQADAFMFTGIGGEKSLEWARNKFRERFDLDRPDDGRRHEIMSLLDEYLTPPGSYLCDDEIEFRRQAEQRYRDTEKD